MITVAPGATFETSVDWGTSGLAGTLRVRLLNGAGGTSIAATTSGIAEFPASSGRYEVTLTAPGTAGQYAVMWDDGSVAVGHVAAGDDVLVTDETGATVGGTGNVYVSRSELKSYLGITVTTHDDHIDRAITASSRAIDRIKKTRFYPTTETRYYSPSPYDTYLDLDEGLNTLTSLKIDVSGDGTYETTWTNGTHFVLDPVNNPLLGLPYSTVILRPGNRFPSYYPNSVQVVGSWGWTETPADVKEACMILASRLYNRRTAPFGVLSIGVDTPSAVRIARNDPDVMGLLNGIPGIPERPIW